MERLVILKLALRGLTESSVLLVHQYKSKDVLSYIAWWTKKLIKVNFILLVVKMRSLLPQKIIVWNQKSDLLDYISEHGIVRKALELSFSSWKHLCGKGTNNSIWQFQILQQIRNTGQGDMQVKRKIALAQSSKLCSWDWLAEGKALAKEWTEPLANLSGYQKPNLQGSFRPVDSMTRQKWQLSSQPAASRQTGMHHSTAELFHLQSQSKQAEGSSASSWYRGCHIPTAEKVFWNL